MILHLNRYESTSDGTFGKMTVGDLVLHTVERPWLNNKPFESCIPAGAYRLEPFRRANGDEVYVLLNEDEGITRFQEPKSKRYTILIHAGNWMTDVVGCIAPGIKRSVSNDKPMVTSSRTAMKEMMARMKYHDDNHIVINWGVVEL